MGTNQVYIGTMERNVQNVAKEDNAKGNAKDLAKGARSHRKITAKEYQQKVMQEIRHHLAKCASSHRKSCKIV